MSKKASVNSLSVALGAVFTVSMVNAAITNAAGNPFDMKPVSSGNIMLAEGKCGEGKCGGGKGGEGRCGMSRMDANGDGNVTKEEFMQGHDAMFDKIDQNGDGVIDPAERKGHMKRMRGCMKEGKCGEGKCGGSK